MDNLRRNIEKDFSFTLNNNQFRDIERLFLEIEKREDITETDLLEYVKKNTKAANNAGRSNFYKIKDTLIKRRFPVTSSSVKIDTKDVFLSKIRPPLENNITVKKEFLPKKIFIERDVAEFKLAERVLKKFPAIPTEIISKCKDWGAKNRYSVERLKEPLLFLVRQRWDFIKPCPCTKGHLNCGYWILNLGFGCPYDCTYCYLQHYSNFPGIILPANIEEFFEKFDLFYKKLKHPIRIGTGEFCDSLALDHITEYSKDLFSYFGGKNLLFELKTKSSNISNLLAVAPPKNIVISWSLNPRSIIADEETGAPSLERRLEAARCVQQHGYKVAFHFDPIIHSEGWEKNYTELIDTLYKSVEPPFAWISLGTLRCNREQKNITEQRFGKSKIFYGELLLGEDKKLRYPEFIRENIYKQIFSRLSSHDLKTPVYLCMESKEIWKKTLGFRSQ